MSEISAKNDKVSDEVPILIEIGTILSLKASERLSAQILEEMNQEEPSEEESKKVIKENSYGVK